MLSCIGIGWGWRWAIWKKTNLSTYILMVCGFYLGQPPYLQVLFSSSPLLRRHGFSFEQIRKLPFFKNTLSQRFTLVQWCIYRYVKNCNTRCTKLSQKRLLYVKTFFFHRKIISHMFWKNNVISIVLMNFIFKSSQSQNWYLIPQFMN